MADGFDVVAVRVEGEGAVIVGVVVGAQPWLTVVLPTLSQGRGMEGIHSGAILGTKGDMPWRRRTAGLDDPEGEVARRTKGAHPLGREVDIPLGHHLDLLRHAQRGEYGTIEVAGRQIVAGIGTEMINHGRGPMGDVMVIPGVGSALMVLGDRPPLRPARQTALGLGVIEASKSYGTSPRTTNTIYWIALEIEPG
jgi:hypothetical protein